MAWSFKVLERGAFYNWDICQEGWHKGGLHQEARSGRFLVLVIEASDNMRNKYEGQKHMVRNVSPQLC